MSMCRGIHWDGRFEALLRHHLPFLGATDQLSADASLRELGLDSMGVIELLADLEDGYAVRFRDDALTMATFTTPGVLWGVLSTVGRAAA